MTTAPGATRMDAVMTGPVEIVRLPCRVPASNERFWLDLQAAAHPHGWTVQIVPSEGAPGPETAGRSVC